ncbi:hypothetical protein [Streptomyces sp. DH12]|uniref:hypothetical protein n=1 Tax=Streptomyces sp. DH12 TaxID=2857010 RepID=UPI001E29D631|nr:hypothetical protein [Streptomyces sp. DH12]
MVGRRVPLPALVSALVLGGLWWWAVLRLALVPEQAGIVEQAAAASGWGLSLLPVHVTGAPGPARGAGRRPRWRTLVRESFPEALRGLVWDVVRAVGRGGPRKPRAGHGEYAEHGEDAEHGDRAGALECRAAREERTSARGEGVEGPGEWRGGPAGGG